MAYGSIIAPGLKGDTGEKGERGTNATINGFEAITLETGHGLEHTNADSKTTISVKKRTDPVLWGELANVPENASLIIAGIQEGTSTIMAHQEKIEQLEEEVKQLRIELNLIMYERNKGT